MVQKKGSTGIDALGFLARLFSTGVERVVVRFEADVHNDGDLYIWWNHKSITRPMRYRNVNSTYPSVPWYLDEGDLRVLRVSHGYKRMKSEVIIHVI